MNTFVRTNYDDSVIIWLEHANAEPLLLHPTTKSSDEENIVFINIRNPIHYLNERTQTKAARPVPSIISPNK